VAVWPPQWVLPFKWRKEISPSITPRSLLGRAGASWSQLDQSWFAAADAADPAALSRSVDLALLYIRGARRAPGRLSLPESSAFTQSVTQVATSSALLNTLASRLGPISARSQTADRL